MSLDAPPATKVMELPKGGVRYSLPCRPRRGSRMMGINLVVGGVLLFAMMSAMLLMSFLVADGGSSAAEASESSGLIRLLGSIFCCALPLLLCYTFVALFGLALAFGRVEIVLTSSSIAASKRVGPFAATHRRPTSLLSGLLVQRGATLAENELQATFHDRSPLTLVWGMSVEQLRQVAADLAERHRAMAPANRPTIAISEKDLA